jgi:hypothetical protein
VSIIVLPTVAAEPQLADLTALVPPISNRDCC